VEVYLEKKLLRQVKTMKYLVRIIDKNNIRRTYSTGARKMSEINIHFSKISKIKLRFNSQSFKTVYTGRIQPLFLYGTPGWAERVESARYRKMITEVQRLINI